MKCRKFTNSKKNYCEFPITFGNLRFPTKGVCWLIAALLLIPLAVAHETPEHTEEFIPAAAQYSFTPWQVVLYAGALLLVLLFVAWCCQQKMSEGQKKALFLAIVIVTIVPTAYLVYTTVHLNVVSATAGPVHWHADYEVWICGQEMSIEKPAGVVNRIGSPLVHDHGDNRIHIEGVLRSRQEASLGAFFHAIGGALESSEVIVPTHEGLVAKDNGDLCDGAPGKLYVFVNGKQIQDPADYVIAPHETVPPGDTVKIVFTSEAAEQINPYTKQFGRERAI